MAGRNFVGTVWPWPIFVLVGFMWKRGKIPCCVVWCGKTVLGWGILFAVFARSDSMRRERLILFSEFAIVPMGVHYGIWDFIVGVMGP